jgi:hypothetical protein
MYLTYKPADEDPQEFIFIPDEINSFDAEAIESATNWTWEEFMLKLQTGSFKARRALLWVLLRTVHRGLAFRDVKFNKNQVELEYDVDEMAKLIKQIKEQPDQDGFNKDAFIAQMEKEMETARPAPAESGKAQELIAGGLTYLPSHRSASILSSNGN